MRIPPLYLRKGYQRFFAGIAIGCIIGWTFFLLQFGLAHARLINKIDKQKTKIEDFEKKIEILTSDDQKANEELAKKFKLHEVNVRFTDPSQKLSNLTKLQLTKLVEDDLEHLIGKDTETIAKSHTLLVQAIQNKVYSLDDQQYTVNINHLYLYTGILTMYVTIRPIK